MTIATLTVKVTILSILSLRSEKYRGWLKLNAGFLRQSITGRFA